MMTYEDLHALEMFLRDLADMPHGKDGEHWRHSVTDAQHDEALRLLELLLNPGKMEAR